MYFFITETKFCKFPIPQQIIIPPSLHPSLLWIEFLPLLTTNRLISKQNKIGCHFSPLKKMKSNNVLPLKRLPFIFPHWKMFLKLKKKIIFGQFFLSIFISKRCSTMSPLLNWTPQLSISLLNMWFATIQ